MIKTLYKKLILFFSSLLMIFSITTVPVMAVEGPYNPYKVRAEVKVRVEGTSTAEIEVKEVTPGAGENIQTRVVNGSETLFFGYEDVGTFKYSVTQRSGNISGITYDKTQYFIDVYVTNDEQNNLYVTALMYKSGSSDKEKEIVFKNIVATPTPSASANPNSNPNSTACPNCNVTPSDKSYSDLIKSGELGNPIVIGLIGITAIAGIGLLLVYRKKDKDDEEE